MTQILDVLPTRHPHQILCRYSNRSPNLQVVHIANIPHWYFERVVFPHDSLLFAAILGATLEIYGVEGITTLRADSIPCERLQMTPSD
ncbi:MAG: DUF1830 domain-containing protein [Leptolyngbya sp. SIO1D8]|nr:DUF1830 domain-containing protein [Leptolyngbya sp. SIO1D8]